MTGARELGDRPPRRERDDVLSAFRGEDVSSSSASCCRRSGGRVFVQYAVVQGLNRAGAVAEDRAIRLDLPGGDRLPFRHQQPPYALGTGRRGQRALIPEGGELRGQQRVEIDAAGEDVCGIDRRWDRL